MYNWKIVFFFLFVLLKEIFEMWKIINVNVCSVIWCVYKVFGLECFLIFLKTDENVKKKSKSPIYYKKNIENELFFDCQSI